MITDMYVYVPRLTTLVARKGRWREYDVRSCGGFSAGLIRADILCNCVAGYEIAEILKIWATRLSRRCCTG